MTTISKGVGRADFLFHRGCDERPAVLWTQDCHDGKGYVPKDLTSWRAELKLLSPLNEEWGTWECTCTEDGFAFADIPGYDTSGAEWLSRASGTWRMEGYGPQGEVELLGWGYFTMA